MSKESISPVARKLLDFRYDHIKACVPLSELKAKVSWKFWVELKGWARTRLAPQLFDLPCEWGASGKRLHEEEDIKLPFMIFGIEIVEISSRTSEDIILIEGPAEHLPEGVDQIIVDVEFEEGFIA